MEHRRHEFRRQYASLSQGGSRLKRLSVNPLHHTHPVHMPLCPTNRPTTNLCCQLAPHAPLHAAPRPLIAPCLFTHRLLAASWRCRSRSYLLARAPRLTRASARENGQPAAPHTRTPNAWRWALPSNRPMLPDGPSCTLFACRLPAASWTWRWWWGGSRTSPQSTTRGRWVSGLVPYARPRTPPSCHRWCGSVEPDSSD